MICLTFEVVGTPLRGKGCLALSYNYLKAGESQDSLLFHMQRRGVINGSVTTTSICSYIHRCAPDPGESFIMKHAGFVDLRVNDEGSEGESFWPAFTDIMTVIVIIFLLVMMSLLVKNMDLVNQLRASLDSERAAAAQAQVTSETNSELNLRLRQLEKESSMLHMRLMDLGEEHNRTLTQLENSEETRQQLKQEVSAIRETQESTLAEKQALQQINAKLDKNRLILEGSILALEGRTFQLNANRLALEKKQSELEKRQANLTSQLEQRLQELLEQKKLTQLSVAEMDTLKVNRALELERLKKLEKEYASLETRYNRLIRPARSKLGKVVTLVRYQKLAGKLSIELKLPTDANYLPVTGIMLHKRLAALQDKFGKKLYVRIIFPDDSGLSYTEAWNLTESLLRMYDYYYQEE